MRARRQLQNRFDSVTLARTLGSYSQLGETYIRSLQRLIADNALQHLHTPGLRPAIRLTFPRPAPDSAGLAGFTSAAPD